MSSFDLRQSDSGVFYLHWTEGRRSKRVSTRTRSLAEAKTFLAEWLTLDTAARQGGAQLCEELWATYFENRHAMKTKAALEPIIGSWKNLRETFALLPVRACTQEVVDKYVALRRAGRIGRCAAKDATIRHELALLRASWNWHAKRKLISFDDVPFFTVPDAPPPHGDWIPREDLTLAFIAAQRLREQSEFDDRRRLSRLERFLWIAVETASRKSAVQELTWDRIDFETGVIDFNPPGRAQTRKRRVAIPISTALLPVLRRAFAERQTKYVLDHTRKIDHEMRKLKAATGIDILRPHVLRHSAGTLMARDGVDLWKIAGVLGDTMATVEKHYLKHRPDHLRGAVNSLSAAPRLGVENGLQRAAEDLTKTLKMMQVDEKQQTDARHTSIS